MSTTKLTCYIIDPSAVQRNELVQLIDQHENVILKQQFTSFEAAVKVYKEQPVDLIIGEAELMDKTILQLIDLLEPLPFYIIVANSRSYAFQAFEKNVIDYLGKPVKRDRFNQAIDKALKASKAKDEISAKRGDYIFVKCNLKKRKVYLDDLRYIEALGDYVKLITTEDNLVVLSTMKAFEKILPADQFLRIHKSYIVNLSRIDKFNSRIVDLEGLELPLSRNRKSQLAQLLSRRPQTESA